MVYSRAELLAFFARQKDDKADILITRGDRDAKLFSALEDGVTNVGYDVTLGGEDRKVYDLTAQRHLDFIKTPTGGKYVEVGPRHTVSVETSECLQLGGTTMGFVKSKVRLVSRGISHISTTVDPNWKGSLLLTFTNMGPKSIRLNVGDPIATVVFARIGTGCSDSGDARLKNNVDRWNEYAHQEADVHRQKIILRSLTVVGSLVLVGLLFYLYKDMVLALFYKDKKLDWQEGQNIVTALTGPTLVLMWLVRRGYSYIVDKSSATILAPRK